MKKSGNTWFRGCIIQAWTSGDCSSSDTVVSDDGCRDVMYASVSVSC